MDIENHIRGNLIQRATAEERLFFGGARSATIASAIQDLAQSDGLRESHMAFFLEMNKAFRAAAGLTHNRGIVDIKFEQGILTPDSVAASEDWAVCPQDHNGKNLWAMNTYSSIVRQEGMFFTARDFPVKWHMEHINERCRQRKSNPIETESLTFLRHNAIALSMLRVFEEEHGKTGNTYLPFALPEKNGILVGHTMHLTPAEIGNRLFIVATNKFGMFPTERYQWLPHLAMTVRTFLGPDEITPAQAKLRMELLRFYQPGKIRLIEQELALFNKTPSGMPPADIPFMQEHQQCLQSLRKLMTSPLWYSAARLPAHLRSPDLHRT